MDLVSYFVLNGKTKKQQHLNVMLTQMLRQNVMAGPLGFVDDTR